MLPDSTEAGSFVFPPPSRNLPRPPAAIYWRQKVHLFQCTEGGEMINISFQTILIVALMAFIFGMIIGITLNRPSIRY